MDHQILRSHYVERRNKHKHWLKRRQFCQCCLSLQNSACFLSMSGKLMADLSLSVLQYAFIFLSREIWSLIRACPPPCKSRSLCKRLCHPAIQLCIVGIAKRVASAAYLVPFSDAMDRAVTELLAFFGAQRHATVMKPRRWCKRLAEEGVDEYEKIWKDMIRYDKSLTECWSDSDMTRLLLTRGGTVETL